MNPQILVLLQDVPGRMFGLDQQTLIQFGINLFNVVILFLILRWLLYKPVSNFLAKRENKIAGDLQHAEEEKAEAEQLKAQFQQKVKEIELEKADILEAARKLAAERGREMEAVAKTEADAMKTRALNEIEMEQQRVKQEFKQSVIDVSSLMVSKFLSRTIDEKTGDLLFDETIRELEGIQWQA